MEQLNEFLNATKNQRKPKIEMYFPDLKLFIDSSVTAMKKATLEEYNQPKRYRLKKVCKCCQTKSKEKSLKRNYVLEMTSMAFIHFFFFHPDGIL